MYFKRKIDVLLDNWLKKENKSSALVVVYVNVGKLKQFKNLDVDTIISNISLRFPNLDFKSNNILIFFDEIQDCHKARLSFKNFKIDGRYNVIGSGLYLVINGYVIGDTTPAPTGYEDVMQIKTMDFEALVFDSLNKAGIEPFYFLKESGLKIDFVISYNGYATLIEAKPKTGNT